MSITPRILPVGIQSLFFAALLSIISLPASADEPSQENLNALLPDACYLFGNYSQTKTLAGLKTPIKSEGKFLYSCDAGLIWHTRAPLSETLIYSLQGKQTKIHTDSTREALNNRLHKHLNTLLNSLIGADTRYINKYFNIHGDREKIQLNPKKRRMKKFITSIDLFRQQDNTDITINHASNQKTSMQIFDTRKLAALDNEQCKKHLASTQVACDVLFQK